MHIMSMLGIAREVKLSHSSRHSLDQPVERRNNTCWMTRLALCHILHSTWGRWRCHSCSQSQHLHRISSSTASTYNLPAAVPWATEQHNPHPIPSGVVTKDNLLFTSVLIQLWG